MECVPMRPLFPGNWREPCKAETMDPHVENHGGVVSLLFCGKKRETPSAISAVSFRYAFGTPTYNVGWQNSAANSECELR